MSRRVSYGTFRCSRCGDRVSRNALGRAAHERGVKCARAYAWLRYGNAIAQFVGVMAAIGRREVAP